MTHDLSHAVSVRAAVAFGEWPPIAERIERATGLGPLRCPELCYGLHHPAAYCVRPLGHAGHHDCKGVADDWAGLMIAELRAAGMAVER